MNATVLDDSMLRAIGGPVDQTLRLLEERFDVRISARGGKISIQAATGDGSGSESKVLHLLEQFAALHQRGWRIRSSDVKTAIRLTEADPDVDLQEHFLSGSVRTSTRRTVVPKSRHQREYVNAIASHDLVFGIGPAGTGKTYLAVAMGVSLLQEGVVKRIILARPAVEAGERLGFLPGDIAAKVDPYLRPLYDALFDMLDPERAQQLIERGTIEVAPLAFMRGRTLSQSFVILDEAQNATSEQMKMFLTRIGTDSKAVVTGDVTQVDLPTERTSGLVEAHRLLQNIEGLRFVHFDDRDVVRHRLVQQIILAYERPAATKSPVPEDSE